MGAENILNILLIIIAAGTFVLSFFIYTRDRKNEVNISFSLLAFCGAIWAFNIAAFRMSTRIESAWFWDKMIYTFGTVFVCSFLYFSIFFPFRKKALSSVWKFLIFSPFFIFVPFLFFTNLFIQDINITTQGNEVKLGPIYLIWMLWFFAFMGWSFINLLLKYRKSTGISKMQIRYILLALLFPAIVSTPFNMILPYFGYYKLIWIGPLFLTILFAIISLAVTKYHLFEIKVILTELLVGAMGIVLLVFPFLMETFWLRVVTISILLLFCISGYLLIRYTHREVHYREQIQKAYEVEKKSHKELKRLDEAKTQFIMATQHHLRTPLSSMMGYLDLLLGGSYGKIVNQKIKTALQKFQTSTKRLTKVVNEFLDISQFQLGKEVVLLKPDIDVEPILNEIIEELQFEVKAKNLELKFQKPKKIPNIKADPEKLKVALFNIIDNGIKYTRKGRITLKCQVSNDKLQIIVKDTGMGILKEELNALFTRIFERSKEAKKTYTTGRGIGLFIANQIIKAHQGKIWAESEGKDKGSTFYVELPIE